MADDDVRPAAGSPRVRNRPQYLGPYRFEDGSNVYAVISGPVPTETALDMLETFIRLKRQELARLAAHQSTRGKEP
jgi:hypothetical protein